MMLATVPISRERDRVVVQVLSDTAVKALHDLCTSGEIRDCEFSKIPLGELEKCDVSSDTHLASDDGSLVNLYSAIPESIHRCTSTGTADSNSDCCREVLLWEIWELLVSLPEFNHAEAALDACVSQVACRKLFARVDKLDDQASIAVMSRIISFSVNYAHWVYLHRRDLRSTIRQALGARLVASVKGRSGGKYSAGNDRMHIQQYLKLLVCIVEGMQAPMSDRVAMDVVSMLVSLHQPNDMIEWRDQVPVIQSYHEVLVQCCAAIFRKCRCSLLDASKDSSIATSFLPTTLAPIILLQGIIVSWPPAHEANTAKEVLLLHEMEQLLILLSPEEYVHISEEWLRRWTLCFGSPFANIRTSQRALQIFKNSELLQLFASSTKVAFYQAVLPALYKSGSKSWNPTVNKMTGLALKKLMDMDAEETIKQFAAATGATVLSQAKTNDDVPTENVHLPRHKRPLVPSSLTTTSAAAVSNDNQFIARTPPAAIVPNLRAFHRGLHGQQPPSTITGIAPWSVGATTHSMAPPSMKPMLKLNGIVTVLPKSASTSVSAGRLPFSTQCHQQPRGELAVDEYLDETSKPFVQLQKAEEARKLLEAFINDVVPQASDGSSLALAPENDWKIQQAAITPTLLPDLKFHDLVFGQVLGTGAFSTVKYARQIIKDKPRSVWPEFAVKIISSALLTEIDYHSSVLREMAILQLFGHPGIARLVSAFRYTQSAYMVLEYASMGDLHSYVLKMGSLSHAQTRFIVGEVLAGLLSIHELGFSYNDLKPENVLITELGHLKLTDFGAVRPQNKDAEKQLLSSIAMLGTLRNGDWRDVQQQQSSSSELPLSSYSSTHTAVEGNDAHQMASDQRIEGTPAYMPPEVLRGLNLPNFQADSWAVGCITLFCLLGKPRYFGDREEVLQQIADDFDDISDLALPGTESSNNHVRFCSNRDHSCDGFNTLLTSSFADDHPSAVNAKAFLRQMVDVHPRSRLSAEEAVQHKYLTSGCMHDSEDGDMSVVIDVRSLHFHSPLISFSTVKNAGLACGDLSTTADDQQWARRQFSVLWAPMPGEVNGGDDPDRKKRRSRVSAEYVMNSLVESEDEMNTLFSNTAKSGGVVNFSM